MNAGAYGGEMKDVLEEITVLTKEGEISTISREIWIWGIVPARRPRTAVLFWKRL